MEGVERKGEMEERVDVERARQMDELWYGGGWMVG